ncbi:hypothetical protein [Salibacterium salarium]|uniref:hypothetical protein n=1 Tax=Salibacterium salarium TaxID=284579 RepID=UPI00163AA470|nr:hypothetical protein [Salibacterium salarium]
MDWELFKVWLKIEGIDIERLSWKQLKTQNKVFENEAKQNSFNYQMALDCCCVEG